MKQSQSYQCHLSVLQNSAIICMGSSYKSVNQSLRQNLSNISCFYSVPFQVRPPLCSAVLFSFCQLFVWLFARIDFLCLCLCHSIRIASKLSACLPRQFPSLFLSSKSLFWSIQWNVSKIDAVFWALRFDFEQTQQRQSCSSLCHNLSVNQ